MNSRSFLIGAICGAVLGSFAVWSFGGSKNDEDEIRNYSEVEGDSTSLSDVTHTVTPTEDRCLRVRRDINSFVQERLIPLVDSEATRKIDSEMVQEVKDLRRQVEACVFHDELQDRTPWNEEEYIRISSRLAFFEVTLSQVVDENNPKITRFLVSSESFGKAVLRLQDSLGPESHH